MILHLINKTSVINQCIASIASGDAILCIEHAANAETVKTLQAQLDPTLNITLYVLTDSSDAKNLNGINLITSEDFVTLTCSAGKVVSWY